MDYEEERRKILLSVADSTLTPGEAAQRLAAPEEARSPTRGPPPGRRGLDQGLLTCRRPRPLRPGRIRVTPSLPLDAEMQAGAMTVRGMKGPIKAEIDAGTLKVQDFASSIDVRVNAGTFTGNGVLN